MTKDNTYDGVKEYRLTHKVKSLSDGAILVSMKTIENGPKSENREFYQALLAEAHSRKLFN